MGRSHAYPRVFFTSWVSAVLTSPHSKICFNVLDSIALYSAPLLVANDLRLTHHTSHFNELPPHHLKFFLRLPHDLLGPRPGGGNGSPCPPRLTTRYIFNVVTMIGVLLFRSQWMDEGVCLSGWIFYSVLFLFCSGRHNVTFLYLLLCISNY